MKKQVPSLYKVLSIAGSDSGGGAGIQADIKTITALGCYATTVVTALTAQNSLGVRSVFEVTDSFVGEQIDAVMMDIGTDVVKTGMLLNRGIVDVVCSKIKKYDIKSLVVDPVMLSKNNENLLLTNAVHALTSRLFPLSFIVTPNIPEAESITGLTIRSVSDAEDAARDIYQLGTSNVLIKGGHAGRSWSTKNKNTVIDILYDGKTFEYIEGEYISTHNTHGTGCTYASAIAAFLAKGNGLMESVVQAKRFVTTAIQKSFGTGKGYGTLDHYRAVQFP
ncbi:bifunctional hydroxymethylpyrimidine kinase/phosphomethylpyrimidine kinase [Candidatus Brocadia sapporoensis]|uniref:hydroxymethylpyrimidine kinase n=1 Tax=Candidatus Brocadia sapporoensis TaxID=392547 RepID=A0A1V6M3F6_9BACT|nr:bifunctional hydroxymethylpyrimidine kinase/phosphomethylpyrimidine kinase [Candidatus Brocadia sapporoensis]MDG6004349.1 bifunctional hydroxymethylpyrimidine kinase/phosphomethylpyrimidine kinase [Candidatus Brocadia sp.]OQD46931.1 bifunctional hydroxymethylpyrimidine kinase/phosphomethylpyrimidine kinase [Candidatus Brocadia sapporoensis]GJQ23255.1 MAG: hydroxymethylpyrimidine/phosphomethylpyrimidine kinase [Candidatus Brocadia sapporoensis]